VNLTPENDGSGNEKNPTRVRIFHLGARRKSAHIDKASARRVRTRDKARLSGNRDTVGNLGRREADRWRRRCRCWIRDRIDQRGVGHARRGIGAAERREVGRCSLLRRRLLESLRSAEAVAITRGSLGLLGRTGRKQATEQAKRSPSQRSASHGMKLNRDPIGHQGETESDSGIGRGHGFALIALDKSIEERLTNDGSRQAFHTSQHREVLGRRDAAAGDNRNPGFGHHQFN